ncbi:MAG: PAS domain-containing protein, partial [Acidobacteria bacterium]|nr:PAS domain-containing protein [Acidobacteriota bacterium]
LYPSYIIITLVSIVAITSYINLKVKDFYYNQKTEYLFNQCVILRNALNKDIENPNSTQLQPKIRTFAKGSDIRITIVALSGQVLADSMENPTVMDNHSDRPEIIQAIENSQKGSSMRYSYTLEEEMMYVAVPVSSPDSGKAIAVIRSAQSIESIEDTLSQLYLQVMLSGLVVIIFAAALSLMVSTMIHQPIKSIEKSMAIFSSGNLEHRVAPSKTKEFTNLADSINTMAANLNSQILMYTRQKNEQDAILASMIEGVIAVDTDEKILKINKAAANFLGTTVEKSKGKLIHEVVRNTELLDFVNETLQKEGNIQKELSFNENGIKYVQAHGTSLTDTSGEHLGALIVLNDITRLQQLENIRRDFVANVSHELKTPITSIKAAAETLKDDGFEDKTQSFGFLDIIINGADRLYAIIEDLLSLSRIERHTEKNDLDVDEHQWNDVIHSAIKNCSIKAGEKEIELVNKCKKGIKGIFNYHLIEQAITNLVDNAIKYSDNNKKVEINCTDAGDEYCISVKDNGFGIEQQYLPRLFERFYRIDKARSSKLGGTGLGLAIVKHIAEAHHGTVEVESTFKKGSIFKIFLKK